MPSRGEIRQPVIIARIVKNHAGWLLIVLLIFIGTELCTVVEAMFSFETLFSIQGDPTFAERAEKLTYNALPATITSDMWAHQYLQQPNEMNAIHSDDHIWVHDGPDSTL